MKIAIHINAETIEVLDFLLQQIYQSSQSIEIIDKVNKSIGFDLAEKINKIHKANIKKQQHLERKKLKKINLKYHEAWALKTILLDLMFLLESEYNKAIIRNTTQKIGPQL